MNLILWDDLALENMAQQKVVVHRLTHDVSDWRGAELNKRIVFRLSSLSILILTIDYRVSPQTYLFIAR